MNPKAQDACETIICNTIRFLNPDEFIHVARREVGTKIIEALENEGWTLTSPRRLRGKKWFWF
jgi:hypothetical protein